MTASWDAFWFASGGEGHLGVVRIVFFLWLLVAVRWTSVSECIEAARHAPELIQPVSFYRIWPFSLIRRHLDRLAVVFIRGWYIAVCSAAAGLMFPVGSIVATALFLLLMGYQQQFGKINRKWNLVPFVMLILSLSPADRLCISSAFQLADQRQGFMWPVQLVRVTIACVWLAAGIAKLRYGGWRWAWSDNVSTLLRIHVMDYCFLPPKAPRLSVWLAQQQVLCILLGAGALAVELLYPLSLVSDVAALVLVPSSVLMIVAFGIVQGPFFRPLVASTVIFWFPTLT